MLHRRPAEPPIEFLDSTGEANSLSPTDTVNFAGSPFPFTSKLQAVADGQYEWGLREDSARTWK
jgi:hypothetical protein